MDTQTIHQSIEQLARTAPRTLLVENILPGLQYHIHHTTRKKLQFEDTSIFEKVKIQVLGSIFECLIAGLDTKEILAQAFRNGFMTESIAGQRVTTEQKDRIEAYITTFQELYPQLSADKQEIVNTIHLQWLPFAVYSSHRNVSSKRGS